MKKISVQLDKAATEALALVIEINRCSISDAVNAAIVAFSMDKQPTIFVERNPIMDAISRYQNGISGWCLTRGIDRARLRYLISQTSKGHSVCGFGNTKNKWRDKQDDREFKTHTAWIAHCLKEDFGIEL